MLDDAGFKAVHEGDEAADIVVINTCGFIGDAKEESVNTILEYVGAKNRGEIKKLFVMGCLSERYREELNNEIPEVDAFYGKFDWTGLVDTLAKKNAGKRLYDRVITTPSHHAYLKISEGCNRFCAFCAIPLITGRYKSRTIEDIEDEVIRLVKRGVKEFNVIAQDLSGYGSDIYGKPSLAQLIDRISRVEGVKWIRLHYAYPADFPMDILDVMARRDNVCKYLDIALQHISDNVLTAMRRHIDKEKTLELLKQIRERVPGIKIRTTLMVGFPGETESDFEELMEFVRTQKFDRMGAFAYSEEEDTYAQLHYEDNVSEETKQQRLDRLMELQENISDELTSEMVGQKVRLLVDEREGDKLICRSQWDSPEVDMTYTVYGSDAQPGDFIEAEITEAYPFDFVAKEIKK